MDEPGRVPDAGLDSVNAEFSPTALAYNLKRAINILGIPAILRAMHA